MNKTIAAIERYLSQYGEKEAHTITLAPTLGTAKKTYQHSVVIPCYNESANDLYRIIDQLHCEKNVLIIIVINQPDSDSNTQENQQLWNDLVDHYNSIWDNHPFHWLNNSNNDILLVDRFSEKIPAQYGVGLARKIGGDIACQLIAQQQLKSVWIHHTDADVHLPDNYLSCLSSVDDKRYSAAVYPYCHTNNTDTDVLKATQYYEAALDYYVSGLRHAQSPYAYHTLGSCIVTHALAYSQARGFPKKAGGEDFYLLNKLAKLGKIFELQTLSPTPQIKIDARVSTRVPFGTGPAVKKIMAMQDVATEYYYYSPDCFVELKQLLAHFVTLFDYCYRSDKSLSESNYTLWLSTLSPALQHCLRELKIEKLFAHIDKQAHSPQQCIDHCHSWLDGFKTLKLIHLLETYYPNQPLNHCLNAEFMLAGNQD